MLVTTCSHFAQSNLRHLLCHVECQHYKVYDSSVTLLISMVKGTILWAFSSLVGITFRSLMVLREVLGEQKDFDSRRKKAMIILCSFPLTINRGY